MRPQQIRSSVPTAATSGNDPTGAVRIDPGRGEAFEFVEFEMTVGVDLDAPYRVIQAAGPSRLSGRSCATSGSASGRSIR